MKSRFLFTASVIWMLSNVSQGHRRGAKIDWLGVHPYVTVRVGWLFEKVRSKEWLTTAGCAIESSIRKSAKSV